MKRYGLFSAGVMGAVALGGVLGAGGEFILGAAAGDGAYWANPRYFYQLAFSAEALWLAGAGGILAALLSMPWYILTRRRGASYSPALLILAAAAVAAGGGRFLATYDRAWIHNLDGRTLLLLGVGVAAAGSALIGGAYAALKLLKRRLRIKNTAAVYGTRLLALGLLAPVIVANVATLMRRGAAPPRRPDVYLVVIDALRADRLGPYGGARPLMPRLEAFAANGVVFRQAYTISSWTKPAVASLLTSTRPSTHGIKSYSEGLPGAALTLPEYLRAAGYTTVGISANGNISRLAGMGDGFDILDATAAGSILEAAGPYTSLASILAKQLPVRIYQSPLARPSIEGMDLNHRLRLWQKLTAGGPRFFYIHYMEPHTPNPRRPEYACEWETAWARVEPKRAAKIANGYYFFEELALNPHYRPDYSDNDIALGKALYDAEVRRADGVFDDFLKCSAPPGGEDNPIIVITSDHGEEFLEHGRWYHGAGMHREIADIPLIIQTPACRPAMIEGPVTLLDIAPTIAALTGGTIPRAWEGWDLTPFMTAGSIVPARPLWLEAIHKSRFPDIGIELAVLQLDVVVADGWYYVHDINTGREYLYDVGADPYQLEDLAPKARDSENLLARPRARLATWRREAERHAYTPKESARAARLERSLRSIGYIK